MGLELIHVNPIWWRGKIACGADAAPRGRVGSAVLHQFLASRACVAVAFGVEGEIVARERSVCPVDQGMNSLIAF